jgi:hypothetical protein
MDAENKGVTTSFEGINHGSSNHGGVSQERRVTSPVQGNVMLFTVARLDLLERRVRPTSKYTSGIAGPAAH